MEIIKMRKLWKRPELIVLVRGTADERVLQGCKSDGYDNGPETSFSGGTPCWTNGINCAACSVVD